MVAGEVCLKIGAWPTLFETRADVEEDLVCAAGVQRRQEASTDEGCRVGERALRCGEDADVTRTPDTETHEFPRSLRVCQCVAPDTTWESAPRGKWDAIHCIGIGGVR